MAGEQCCSDSPNTSKTSKETTIFEAAQVGNIQTCRSLVSQQGVKILNEHDEKGHTPLHWAALGGQIEVIKFFINCGADVNRQSKAEYGPYPIHWACVSGHIMAVDLLLQNGANIDCADNKGCTPLIISAQYGKTMQAGYLIGKGAKVYLTDTEGDNALHWAAFKGNSETVQLLLYSGFDPKQKDKFGQTPLHLACLSGNLLTVEHIVDMDVDMNIKDANGKTPLMLAVGRDHTDVIHFMQSKLNRFVKCSLRDIIFGPPGRSRGPLLFYFANLFLWGYPVYFYDVLPMSWEFTKGFHVVFLLFNVLMWINLYFANSREPGYLDCNTPDYDMALKQGSGSGDHSNAFASLDTSIIKFFQNPEQRTIKVKQVKPFLEFLSYYKRKVYPDKLDKGLLEAIEHHIEEIEPQFRSASFAQLWHALRSPLTEFFRPKSSDYLLEQLTRCLYGNTTRASPQSKLPEYIEDLRRDLIICKIGQILDGNKTAQSQKLSDRPVFYQLWKVLRGPMTPLLIADLRTMVRELAQYTSRFEMAGIQYQLPGKMSEIRRDVVICKVDDVFNALYDTNVNELEREL